MPSLMERLIGERWPEYLRLVGKVEQMAGTQADFNARMGKIDAATTEIAADLKKLREDLADGGEISDANLAMLDAKIAVLEAMGKDPEPNPVTD